MERQPLSPEALLVEQASAQKQKCRHRTLAEYDRYVFSHLALDECSHHGEYARAVAARFGATVRKTTVAPLFGGMSPHKRTWGYFRSGAIVTLLKHLSARQGRGVRWVDVGCGHGFAQRDFLRLHPVLTRRMKLACARVDLFAWPELTTDADLEDIAKLPRVDREEWTSRVHSPATPLILGDATSVQFGACDLITAIETIQYYHDKVAALCNWYNQLADGGIMVVATEGSWSDWVRDEVEMQTLRNGPVDPVRAMLQGADFITSGHGHPEKGISILMLFKTPGTRLIQASKLLKVSVNPEAYKASYYSGNGPLARIESEATRTAAVNGDKDSVPPAGRDDHTNSVRSPAGSLGDRN